jgi:hypothetical protein
MAMALSKTRYIGPTILFIIGFYFAAEFIPSLMSNVPSVLNPSMTTSIGTDIVVVLSVAIPILFLEYMIFAVPGAALVIGISRFFKAASYDMNIMTIGREFGGTRLIRRAATPALFSVASSEMLILFVTGLLNSYGVTEAAVLAGTGSSQMYLIILSLISSLIFMPIALLFFMPTWVLNDAGVVTHLREDKMKVRQPPDTQGVGRWAGGLLGGYAFIAFPLAMFTNHFYTPYIVNLQQLTPTNLFISFLWIVGLPLLVMAFILPVVGFNEAMQTRMKRRVWGIAKRLGATVIKKEKVEVAKRTRRPLAVEDIETVFLNEEKKEQEIILSAKRLKAQEKENEKKRKARAKKKKKNKK